LAATAASLELISLLVKIDTQKENILQQMNTATTSAHYAAGAGDIFREEAIPFVIYNPELRSKCTYH